MAPDLVESLEFPLLINTTAGGSGAGSGSPPRASAPTGTLVPAYATLPSGGVALGVRGTPPLGAGAGAAAAAVGAMRPGTAGRLRMAGAAAGLDVGEVESPVASPSPVRRAGVGASGARPPSAATYAARAAGASNDAIVTREDGGAAGRSPAPAVPPLQLGALGSPRTSGSFGRATPQLEASGTALVGTANPRPSSASRR